MEGKMSIVWESPEPIVKKKSKNEILFEQLMDRPGVWGRIGTSKNFKAATQRMYLVSADARKRGFGGFEFTARKLGNNNGAIYARYAGDGLPEFAYGKEFIISN
jgi:hypothetical protein